MKAWIAGASLLIGLAAATGASAQLFCATNFGSCGMNAGMPGQPCFCPTMNGPIQGITQGFGGGMAARMPNFCCTPAGRLGPFNNNSIGPGQVCQVMGPSGPLMGQACY